MIYKSFNELIPNLELTVFEYYLCCYNMGNKLFDNPIKVYSLNNNTVLGFKSNTKKNISDTSFNNDSLRSKDLFYQLQAKEFYFMIYFNDKNPETLNVSNVLFDNEEELKNYMINFLKELK